MVTYTETELLDYADTDENYQSFERIRVRHDGVMPVGSSRASYRTHQRSQPSKRTHRAPQHCRGAQHRRTRKWL